MASGSSRRVPHLQRLKVYDVGICLYFFSGHAGFGILQHCELAVDAVRVINPITIHMPTHYSRQNTPS